MTWIIRQALSERILQSQQAMALLRDFSQVTNLPLRLATPLGLEISVPGSVEAPTLCQWMLSASSNRRQLCAGVIQRGMESSKSGSCSLICPAGLREAAIPLKLGGETIGYLLIGQVADAVIDVQRINRWRHSLERVNQSVGSQLLREMVELVPVVEQASFDQVVRLAQWLANSLSAIVGKSILEPTERLPASIIKACAYLRSHYKEDLSLADVARHAGLSKEHFCTLFHKSTGLRYTEYLTRVRVEHAAKRLRQPEDASITEVAFAAGFQSIAHFNRRFKEIMGTSPRDYRKTALHSPQSSHP